MAEILELFPGWAQVREKNTMHYASHINKVNLIYIMSSYTILCDIIMEFVSSSCWGPRAGGVCSADSPSVDSVKSLWCNFCWKRCVVAPSCSQLFSSNHIYAWLRFVVGMKWRSKLIFTTLHTWRHFHLQAITLANSFSMLQVIFLTQTNSCFHLAVVKKKNVQPMPKLNIFFPRCCFPCAGNWDQIPRRTDTWRCEFSICHRRDVTWCSHRLKPLSLAGGSPEFCRCLLCCRFSALRVDEPQLVCF